MRYDRYDAGYRGGQRWLGPGWYPGEYMADGPLYGWGMWGAGWGWPLYGVAEPYGEYGYRAPPPPPPPRESETYGRGGDLAARRWAERHGYDIEMTIIPRNRYDARPEGGGYRRRPRGYDRW